MKKIICLVVTLGLLLGICGVSVSAAGDFSGQGVTALSLETDNAIAFAVRTEDSALLTLLSRLLGSSELSGSPPADARRIGTLTVEKGFRTPELYTIYAFEDRVYARSGVETHLLPREDFFSLLAQIPDFYRFAGIPEANLGGGVTVPAQESSYLYRRLDDVYYQPQLSGEEIPVILPVEAAMPVPAFSPGEDSVVVQVVQGENVLLEQGSLEELAAIEPLAGIYRVTVDAAFLRENVYQGEVRYIYDVRVSDAVVFSLSGEETEPGGIVVLRADNTEGQQIGIKTNLGVTPTFFDDGTGSRVALLPVTYQAESGSYYVELSCLGVTQRFDIAVAEKGFPIERNVQSALGTTLSTAYTEYNNTLLPLRWTSDGEQHWEGRFLSPVQNAQITSQFGAYRFSPGSEEFTRHEGVDYDVMSPTQVSASNAGRVLYAGNLKLTGRTVLIEHGYGLKTWYFHMDRLSVNTGQMVERGQKIGEVGVGSSSTQSSHLHFAMSVNSVYVNPDTTTNTDLLILGE